MLIQTEGYLFFLGKECFKKENFEQGKVYLPSTSQFPLGGTTHFEIIATNCDRPGFEGLPLIKDEDVPKLMQKLNGKNQIDIDDFEIIINPETTKVKEVVVTETIVGESIDLSNFS